MGKKGVDALQWGLIILAFAGGWLGYSHINQVSEQAGWGLMRILGVTLVTISAATIGLYLNIILHEAGHLVGGLLSGYRFAAFCVFNLTILKENGKLTIKKYKAPGASGICVLSPPDIRNGTYPFKLYVSGGFLTNFLVSAACFSLFYYLADTADFWARAFLVVGIICAFLGFINFLPLNADTALSDGYLLFNIGKEKNTVTRRGCWSLFRFQALDAEGVRPRNIPAEVFNWVDIGDIRDIFILATACNQYKYLLDRQELNKARALMQALCDNLHNVSKMQKMSCYFDLFFHALIDDECRQEEMDRLYTKELKDYAKAARSDISVQRIMYAYARLVLKDAAQAKEYLDLFNKTCAFSLWSGTSLVEKGLIALIDTIADNRENN